MILVFLVILGGALFLNRVFKERLEYTIPTFMLGTIVILYINGLVFNLMVGFVMLLILACVGFGLTIYKIINKSTRTDTVKEVFTTPFFVFMTLCAFIYVVNITRQFQLWDEFSHWGPMIRETVRLGDFHNQIGSALFVHRDYPPGITLFQYFFLRLAGGFSEQDTFRALQLLTLSLMLPAFSKIRSKIVIGCIFIIVVLLPDALGMSTYFSIYTDTVLGVLLGLFILIVLSKCNSRPFYYMNLFLLSIVMVLTKQIGLLLILIPVMILGMEWIIELVNKRKGKKGNKGNKKIPLIQLKSIGVIALGAIFALTTWGARLRSVNVTGGQFSVGDMIGGTFELLRGNFLPHQVTVMDQFVRQAFMADIVPFFALSFLGVSIIFSLVGIWLYIASKREEEMRLLPLAIGTPLSMLMYGGAIAIIYAVGFCEFEGVRLASYGRYMGTIVVGIGVGLFLVTVKFFVEEKNIDVARMGKILLFTGVFCSMMVSGVTYHRILISGLEPRPNFEEEFKREHPNLFGKVNLEEDKVYIIMQGTDGLDYWRLRYYANPLETNPVATWSIGSKVSEYDAWTYVINCDEWSEILLSQGFDFVYLHDVNQQFIEEFGDLFYNQEDIRNHNLLKVAEEAGRALLKGVE